MTSTPARPNVGTSRQPIDILLVEDNPGDVRLLEEAFKETEIDQTHRVFTNGDAALDFLLQSSEPSYPDLILLDLDLPGKDGCEVLEILREKPQLEWLPVIMLSGSSDSEDVERCYNAKANAYLTKPTDPSEFVSIVEAVEQFWCKQATLPPPP